MSGTVRAALLLAATLAVGWALGIVSGGALARQRRERIEALRRPPGFAAHLESVIRPRDEAQRAAVRPVLEVVGARNERVIRDANAALRAGVDSLRAVLAPLLDAEQRARLDAEIRRLPPLRPGGGGGRPPGPPPFGPPPFGPPPAGPPRH
jgi:hypothetical protein